MTRTTGAGAGPTAAGRDRRRRRPGRTASAAAALAAATSLLAGCHDGRGQSPVATSPSTATVGDQGITDEERALRREAVRRLTAFEARNQAILASGSATPEARDFYRRHLQDWRAAYAQLRRQERQGVRIARAPVVLSTEVTSLRSFQDNAAEIVLVRCLDRSDLGVTRNGVPVPPTYEEPVAQEVVVERYENRTWRLGPFVTTDRPCRP